MSKEYLANENQITKRFICFPDKLDCEFDYGEGKRGVRLKGFQVDSPLDLFKEATIYTFDIDSTDFYSIKSTGGKLYTYRFIDSFISGERYALITIIESEGNSYYYPSFSTEKPIYIKIETIAFQYFSEPEFKHSKQVLQFITDNNIKNDENSFLDLSDFGDFKFCAFGVGQGMCSLAYNEINKIGILFDSGAGTPVKRYPYQKNKIQNSLHSVIDNLETLYLILSHLDSDHYRLLHWDKNLLSKVDCIFIPAYENWLDAKDAKFKAFTIGINNLYIKGNNFRALAMKTNPNTGLDQKNNKAFVSMIEIDQKLMLLPGDYSYSMMTLDNNKKINDLMQIGYDFINVPHHGDYASRLNIPTVNCDGIAFFSAGNHEGYKHPNSDSLYEHQNQGYNNIIYGNSGNITIEYSNKWSVSC